MDEPRIVERDPIKLVGLRMSMSLTADRTTELWRTFRSRIDEVTGRVGNDRYSVKVYGQNYSFARFDPAKTFDKWAAVAVSEPSHRPEGFESIELPGGRYAVFVHRGTPATASKTFGFIFGSWLPASGFELDHRPHFEIMGENYNPFDPEAEEEVLIPIKNALTESG